MPQKSHRRSSSAALRFTSQPKHHPRAAILSAIENAVLLWLYQKNQAATLHDFAQALTASRAEQRHLKEALNRLVEQRLLQKRGRNMFLLHQQAGLFTGIFASTTKGYGFVRLSNSRPNGVPEPTDVFIPAAQTRLALHGDTVVLRILHSTAPHRYDGAIVGILHRSQVPMAGIYHRDRRGGLVIPEDPRHPATVRVLSGALPEPSEGQMVLVLLTDRDPGNPLISGKIVEILGDQESIDVQMRLVADKFSLPRDFSPPALQEAEQLPIRVPAKDPGRKDLRTVQHVTIDGETAQDFDDAIAVLSLAEGFRLYVSIADVSYYVRPGTALDEEARQRGTSVYFPGRVIPMLPEKLSHWLCSLVPEEDRFCLTAVLDFSRTGELRGKSFCRSLITSHRRLTYTAVAQLLDEEKNSGPGEESAFLPMLRSAAQLARLLQSQREKRGAIGFTLPEAAITLDDSGHVQQVGRASRNFAHQMIEEFMLAANEAVAATFTEQRQDLLYRIHELPDVEKVEAFFTFAATLGLPLPAVDISPAWFSAVLRCCQGTPKEYVVNNLLLRTMQQARYSPHNVGHFGLAATDYTHFTSPIRRYPDLLVHRALCRLIVKNKRDTVPADKEQLEISGNFLSARERTAIAAEREMNDRLRVFFMARHIGKTFSAIISGVTATMLFVELLDLFVSGAIATDALGDDHYFFDERHHRLSGELRRKVYQLGDLLQVTVTDVDTRNHRINFAPAPLTPA